MRLTRYAAGRLEDLPENIGVIVKLGEDGGECALYREGDKVFATGSTCPHQNAWFQNMPCSGGQVTCTRHFYQFDLKTGECLTVGGYGIPVFPVTIEAGEIYVTIREFNDE